jgi:hypothetical protein
MFESVLRDKSLVLLAVMASVGCGRYGYDKVPAETESIVLPVDGGEVVDTDGPAVALVVPPDGSVVEVDASVPLGLFGAPTLTAELSHPDRDDDPALTGDRLEIFFKSRRETGSNDIWFAVRGAVTEPWGAPGPLLAANSSSRETSPEISRDGLTLWFASDRPGGQGGYDIWKVIRADRTASWGTPTLVSELNSAINDIPGTPSGDGLTLVFHRDLSGSDRDLFLTTRTSTSASWGPPRALVEINSPGLDQNGHLVADGAMLYFASNRPGGDLDLYSSTRVGDSFAAPVPMDELNSGDDESDPWVSADMRHIYFSSDRFGNDEIMQSNR